MPDTLDEILKGRARRLRTVLNPRDCWCHALPGGYGDEKMCRRCDEMEAALRSVAEEVARRCERALSDTFLEQNEIGLPDAAQDVVALAALQLRTLFPTAFDKRCQSG